MDIFEKAILNKAYSYYRVNLTKNIMLSPIFEFVDGVRLDYSDKFGDELPSYSELIEQTAEKYVATRDKKEYAEKLSAEYLINQYNEGNTIPEYTCKINSSTIGWHYRLYKCFLSQEEVTGDILSINVAYEVTEEIKAERAKEKKEKERSALLNILSSVYNVLYHFDLETGKATFLHGDSDAEKFKGIGKGTDVKSVISNFCRDYIGKVVAPEDQEKVLKTMDYDRVMDFLRTNTTCSVQYRAKRNLEDYVYMEMSFIKAAEKRGKITEVVVAFRLVDQQVRHELEQNAIIEAMASDYDAVFLINTKTEKLVSYGMNWRIQNYVSDFLEIGVTYDRLVKSYVQMSVFPSDQEKVLAEGCMANICEELKTKKSFEILYRSGFAENQHYVEMKFVKVGDAEGVPEQIALGFRNRSEEVIKNYVNEKLSDDYISIYMVDLERDRYVAIKEPVTTDVLARAGKSWKAVCQAFALECSEDTREVARRIGNRRAILEDLGILNRREYLYKHQKSKDMWRRAVIHVLERKNGIPSTIIMTVSKLDMYAAERQELTSQLESRNTELAEALKEAESGSRAKTSFLFNMSHDIRTPMNAIIGYDQKALKHIDNIEEVKDCLEKIDSSSQQLLDLLNDVLEMSRIETGKMAMDIEKTKLSELDEELGHIFNEIALQKKLKVATIRQIEHDYVYADKLHLNRILMNIRSNAIKYTPVGGSVTCSIIEHPAEKLGYASYEFIVEDTGIGMSKDFIPHIFDTFAREKTSTVSRIQGTGLGMSITKDLLELMDGRITVESEQGKGTKVSVRVELQMIQEEVKDAVLEPRQDNNYNLNGKKALVVEDNMLNSELLCDMLEDEGVETDTADNGIRAVEKIESVGTDYYDFVLMDIQMPYMDGYEATKEIRKMPGSESLPIIAVSANAFEEDRKKSLAAGMNEHIAKPVNMALLMKIMADYNKK